MTPASKLPTRHMTDAAREPRDIKRHSKKDRS
jgi:hypothetical protein